MITYDNDGIYFLWNLFKRKGSVFPKALMLAGPSTLVSSLFVYYLHSDSRLAHFRDQDSVMNNNAIWGGFSFAVGFLVIFRTSQAYNRFWEGCTNMQKMGAEWYDACAALIAFTKHSTRPRHEVMKFQNMLIRLFSMLHAAACGEIEESGMGYDHLANRIGSFDMELIDAHSFSDECLLAVQSCDAKTEMIMQWIQQFIVENIKTQILSIPPPILSRSFQEIATGMVHFNEAMKIANVPFPFPYAQSCDMLLVMHWFVVPFIISQWVMKPWWAGIFAFIMVFTMWTLNFIAIELENPFGCDANDIDGPRMQMDMNNHLRVLIREETMKTPTFKSESKSEEQDVVEQQMLWARAAIVEHGCNLSFKQLWADLHSKGPAQSSSSQAKATVKHAPASRFRATVKPGVQARMSIVKEARPGFAIAMPEDRILGGGDTEFAHATSMHATPSVQFLQVGKQDLEKDVNNPVPLPGNGVPANLGYLEKEPRYLERERWEILPPPIKPVSKNGPADVKQTYVVVEQTETVEQRETSANVSTGCDQPHQDVKVASAMLPARTAVEGSAESPGSPGRDYRQVEPAESRGNVLAANTTGICATDAAGCYFAVQQCHDIRSRPKGITEEPIVR